MLFGCKTTLISTHVDRNTNVDIVRPRCKTTLISTHVDLTNESVFSLVWRNTT